ncbi:hypothetical protein L1049_003119 [Liquidambar formosana]|uniref:RRM domain-containing protein n=1 Tax=Liquidambar formosana TaxID=63359 RepID=A0AAP0R797_LIQFO
MASREKWESLYTVFVDNLPDEMDAPWLRNIFSWCGVVKDSFILNKRRSNSNSRFGFIRYETIREARAAAKELNGVFCLYSKLFVKLADYGWNRSKMRLAKKGHFGCASNRSLDYAIASKPLVVNGPKGIADKRTFAEVVAGAKARPGGDHIIEGAASNDDIICADLVDEKWLDCCLVGEVEHMEDFLLLEDQLLKDGGVDFFLRPLGGKKVLIVFQDANSKKFFASKSQCGLHKLFARLENWVPSIVNLGRLVWVSIVGVLLHAWN